MLSHSGKDCMLLKKTTETVNMETSVTCFFWKNWIDLPQYPTIPLLGIYSKDALSYYTETFSNMSIGAPFIIASK